MKKLIYPFLLLLIFITPLSSFGGVPPLITSVTVPSSGLKYDKYEIIFTTDQTVAGSANPYDPYQFNYYAEFWSPTGKYYKVNAFYFNGVDDYGCPWVDPAGDGTTWQQKQTLTLNATKNWKIRFSPNETSSGVQWKCRITAQNGFGLAYSPSASTYHYFWCTTTSTSLSNKGFISKANQRYLKFDDGSPFYPVGDNAPFFKHDNVITPGDPSFIEAGSCLVKSWMDEMTLNNENFFVYDVNFFYAMSIFGPDYRDGKNYYSFFNQRDSWQLDEIITYAHQKGVYIDLALFSHSDLGNLSYNFYKWSLYNPFNSSVSLPTTSPDIAGTCNDPFAFLTNSSALQIQKNLLRYIVARWGYSNNIMSWELLDEVDQFNNSYDPDFSGGQPALTTNIANWHASTKAYINSVDPQKHLVCTGNMATDPNASVSMNSSMDFVISKTYTNQGPSSDPTKGGWIDVDFEKTSYDYASAFNTKYFTPFFMVEIGYFTDNWFLLPDYDPTMYGLHGLLWSSLFSGAMGPSCFWTHQEITYDKPLAIANFKGIGAFTKNSLPLLSEEYKPFYVANTGASALKLYYLKNTNSDIFYGWAQDLNYDFKKILRSTLDPAVVAAGGSALWTSLPPPPPYLQDLITAKPALSAPSNHNITLSVGKNGVYDVTWYNTETGSVEFATTASSTSNSITISIPVIPNKLRNGKYGDAAFKVEYKCAAQWNASVLNATAPSNALVGSDIEMSIYGNVFFVATDNRVHIMYDTGFYWTDAALNSNTGIVRANSDLARGQYDKINYIATDNKIHQYYWNGSVWIEAALCSTTNLVRAASSLVCDQNSGVYYFASDNKVHIYWYDNVNLLWAEGSLGGTMNARTDSDLAIDYLGNIFYIGTDNRIYRYFWSGSAWSNSIINASAPANVKAGSSLTCDASGSVYYIANDGTNGRIHRYKKAAGVWTEENFASSTPTNTIKAGSDITVTPIGSVFFVGTDNRMHNYWLSGSTWLEATLNLNDPINVSRHIASDANGNIFYNSLNVSGSGNKIHVNYYGCQSAFKLFEENSSSEESKEIIKDATVNLYPNPNNGSFNVDFSVDDGSAKIKLEVFNLIGQLVTQMDIDGSVKTAELNISDPKNGIYILKVTSDNKTYYKKFNIIAD